MLSAPLTAVVQGRTTAFRDIGLAIFLSSFPVSIFCSERIPTPDSQRIRMELPHSVANRSRS